MKNHRLHIALAAATLVSSAAASDPFGPPAEYYNSISHAPADLPNLKQSLHELIRTNWNFRNFGTFPATSWSYDTARNIMEIIDADPDNPTNIILFYNGQSVDGEWDFGGTWNREHTWPVSRGVGETGPDYSDLHQLRPCNPGVNSSRSNLSFGSQSGFWDPDRFGETYRGHAARAAFYSATRYEGPTGDPFVPDFNTRDLELVNGAGSPSAGTMGDLAQLIEWHYAQPAIRDTFERRRNHLIFSDDLNDWLHPENEFNNTREQGNRNPFVDRPQYVWAIWGPTPNDSTITAPSSVELGRVIQGEELPETTLTLTKTGSAPTSYDLTLAGDPGLFVEYEQTVTAANAYLATGRTFVSNNQQTDLPVGIMTDGSVGLYTATITVDNTDLTSAGAGQGRNDADDVIAIAGAIVAASEASFDSGSNIDNATVDLGEVLQNAAQPSGSVTIFNLGAAGLTADLDITSVIASGDVAVVNADLGASGGLINADSPGLNVPLTAITTAAPGDYETTYTINVADEPIPGAQPGTPLMLTLRVAIVAPACPGDADGNGMTDLDDFSVLAVQFGQNVTPGTGADLDGSGFVDLDDFSVLAVDFGCGQ